MKLEFEIIKQVGKGSFPDLLHFANTQGQVFYVKNGELQGLPSNNIDYGKWENINFQEEVDVSPDENITNFEVDALQGFGAIGGYKTDNTHKMIIYEFAFSMDRYLNNGSIKHSIDNPISSFTLALENPDLKDPELKGNVAIDEHNSLLNPGAKLTFKFSAGDSEEYDIGVFYVDRSNFTLLNEVASVDGRNIIGKALKDQTLDEMYRTNFEYLHAIVEEFLKHGKLDYNQYMIESSGIKSWFDFKPNMDILQALEEICKVTKNWKVSELVDGTVVVGSPGYINNMNPSGTYTFQRNKDIFSRNITRDDMQAYRRVCVHDSEFDLLVFKDVESYTGWNLQANKTLYVQVPDGTRETEAEGYAEELADRIELVGKIESFTGPIRPHLQCGDEAIIIDEKKGYESLGLITEVEHIFGKNGFYTNFTVDSGGKLGKGRITDFIGWITKDTRTEKTRVGHDEESGEEGTIILHAYEYGTYNLIGEFTITDLPLDTMIVVTPPDTPTPSETDIHFVRYPYIEGYTAKRIIDTEPWLKIRKRGVIWVLKGNPIGENGVAIYYDKD